MLLIITMATYTLGKIAMTAVPAKRKKKKKKRERITATCNQIKSNLIYSALFVVRTYRESKRPQDVDNLNAQVKVVKIFLKNSWGIRYVLAPRSKLRHYPDSVLDERCYLSM